MGFAQNRARYEPLKAAMRSYYWSHDPDEVDQLCDIAIWKGTEAAIRQGCPTGDGAFISRSVRWHLQNEYVVKRSESSRIRKVELTEKLGATSVLSGQHSYQESGGPSEAALFQVSVDQIRERLPILCQDILRLLSMGHNQSSVAVLLDLNVGTVSRQVREVIRPAFEDAGWGQA